VASQVKLENPVAQLEAMEARPPFELLEKIGTSRLELLRDMLRKPGRLSLASCNHHGRFIAGRHGSQGRAMAQLDSKRSRLTRLLPTPLAAAEPPALGGLGGFGSAELQYVIGMRLGPTFGQEVAQGQRVRDREVLSKVVDR
jgi:hypothetical protein